MKTRLFITLLVLTVASPAAAQTAQDARDYLTSQCGSQDATKIEISDDGVLNFTYMAATESMSPT